MSLASLYSKFRISFEIFPPKTEAGIENLYQELEHLAVHKPAFVSVTYGAGGSTRDKTLDLSLEIQKRFTTQVLVHFTCVGASREDIKLYLERVKKLGLTNILALRGDPPAGDANFKPAPNGFSYASELIKYIREINGFSIAAAAYPTKHPEAKNFSSDLDNLKRKVDAGAELLITQLFFDNDDYYRLTDAAHKKGITVPIIPGIMPITSASQVERIPLFGTTLPDKLKKRLSTLTTGDEYLALGIDYATEQCRDLLKNGVRGFHFYPLNKAYSCDKIIRNLSL